ncbi:hypothetical protein TWF225_009104 [Orbilia oligospora]|uniref:Gas1-like protein n=1 Tax=Orbilia oligospora TaxID=2813651 RepID=A0A8H2HJ95_ORBOL|nr:hypothetical protein TWF225_009104 [Orbilia oligospora]KAF3276057.1 hypothetical protein TWF132_002521 [Orbilia oligospora]TGJ63450.1 hypothetical protein EYR41_011377 [Orbilia oligospora]
MHSKILISAFISALIPSISAHSVITVAVGNEGGPIGAGLGMDPSIPRTGTGNDPFQQDSTVFGGQRDVQSAKGCGRTPRGGPNNVQEQVLAMAKAGKIPQVRQGGEIRFTLHQVNADGAGPFICMIDTTGTGNSFVAMEVSQQVAGAGGVNPAREASTNALFARFGATTTCTGEADGVKNICMVRCQNAAGNGPFGGCVPVQIVQTVGAPENTAKPVPPAENAQGGNAGNNNGGNNNNGNNNGNNNNQNGNNGNNNNGNGNNNGGNNNNNNGGNGGNNGNKAKRSETTYIRRRWFE